MRNTTVVLIPQVKPRQTDPPPMCQGDGRTGCNSGQSASQTCPLTTGRHREKTWAEIRLRSLAHPRVGILTAFSSGNILVQKALPHRPGQAGQAPTPETSPGAAEWVGPRIGAPRANEVFPPSHLISPSRGHFGFCFSTCGASVVATLMPGGYAAVTRRLLKVRIHEQRVFPCFPS